MKLPTAPTAANPHAGVRVFADYAGPVRDRADVVVIGSGPGGAVVAKELAEAGKDVVLLEEGPPFGAKDFSQEAGAALRGMLREAGMRSTRGNMFIPTMQAVALGGGSLVNSAICVRAPGWVLDKWTGRTGVELTRADLDPHYERVERFLHVGPTPDAVQGMRNHVFKRGCDALGIPVEPTPRNVKHCRGSAECFNGCRNGAKQSTDVSYVPAAIRAGARVYTSVRAEQVVTNGRRATAVRGRVVAPGTLAESHPVEIEAGLVVLAAGALATPLILQRSRLGNPTWVGRDLGLHPGLAIMAIFDEPIHPWQGATQGYHSMHFLEQGMKLEVLWAPPAVLAARFPGLGHEFQKHLLTYDRMSPFDVIIAPERSTGRVTGRRGSWDPDIVWDFDQGDVNLIAKGVALLSDIAWAAGATAILPGLHGLPDILRSKDEAKVLRERPIRGQDTIAAANHVFGTTRMSRRPEDGVVDVHGRVHELDNVYVTDTGNMAGSPAVNPMLTCMAIADRVAQHLASR